jgi:hypothetical protein
VRPPFPHPLSPPPFTLALFRVTGYTADFQCDGARVRTTPPPSYRLRTASTRREMDTRWLSLSVSTLSTMRRSKSALLVSSRPRRRRPGQGASSFLFSPFFVPLLALMPHHDINLSFSPFVTSPPPDPACTTQSTSPLSLPSRSRVCFAIHSHLLAFFSVVFDCAR